MDMPVLRVKASTTPSLVPALPPDAACAPPFLPASKVWLRLHPAFVHPWHQVLTGSSLFVCSYESSGDNRAQ